MASQQSPVQAPDFTLDHALGHSVTLSQFRGKKAVVIFASRDSSAQLKEAIKTIFRSFSPDQVAVINVLDMHGAPRPARKIIKGKLKKGYEEQLAENQAAGMSGDIHMLVDWTGDVIASFGVQVDQQAVGAVLDAEGRIIGWAGGDQMGQQAVAILSAN